jgi:hypothetical protein
LYREIRSLRLQSDTDRKCGIRYGNPIPDKDMGSDAYRRYAENADGGEQTGSFFCQFHEKHPGIIARSADKTHPAFVHHKKDNMECQYYFLFISMEYGSGACGSVRGYLRLGLAIGEARGYPWMRGRETSRVAPW